MGAELGTNLMMVDLPYISAGKETGKIPVRIS